MSRLDNAWEFSVRSANGVGCRHLREGPGDTAIYGATSRISCLNQGRNATRLDVESSPHNGLHRPSQIAIDKITVIPADKIGAVIGRADDALLLRVNRALALFLSIV
jgi:mRNA-degrading endonuclease toxin of MazEF toxin-antitoxin module